MKIRGNTIGTNMKPEKNLTKATALSAEEQAQARQNIGAASADAIGDIESALDSIIAIQEELINNGGGGDYCDNCGELMNEPYYCDNCGTSYSFCEWCGVRYIDEGGPPPCDCESGGETGWYETCPDCGEEYYTEGGPHDGCSGGGPDEWEGPWFDCPNCGCGWGEYPESDTVTCPDCGHTWQYE